jgi:hypothetical protein
MAKEWKVDEGSLGVWIVELDPEDRRYVATVNPYGHYTYPEAVELARRIVALHNAAPNEQ